MLLFASCSSKDEKASENISDLNENSRSGGMLIWAESEKFGSLYPHEIHDWESWRIASQLYEGLYTYNTENLQLQTRLAESAEVNSDGTEYTFRLKKNVYFHDDACFSNGKGREMTAQDVVYSFTRLLEANEHNKLYYVFRNILFHGKEHYDASLDSPEEQRNDAVMALDKYTVKLQLKRPSPLLYHYLASPCGYIFPKEAVEFYGDKFMNHPVGTGAFELEGEQMLDPQKSQHTFVRNENYHRVDKNGKQLPYLDAISVRVFLDKSSEIEAFKKEDIHLVYRLPTDDILNLMEFEKSSNPYHRDHMPEANTHYIGFNTDHAVFRDENFRKAISFAIDRRLLLEFTLNNEGDHPGRYGITPVNVFDHYPAKSIEGYHYSLDSARYYLEKCKYTIPKSFTFAISSDGERNIKVAKEIKKQLKENLNITLGIEVLPLNTLLQEVEHSKIHFYLGEWNYMYFHPDHFINSFYSEEIAQTPDQSIYPDITHYSSRRFNRLYESCTGYQRKDALDSCLASAEKVILQNAPLVVLWYGESYRIMQPYLKGMPNNALQFRDLSTVYFDKPRTIDQEKL
jgi:peptide/nickel transport system substrate-binding protein